MLIVLLICTCVTSDPRMDHMDHIGGKNMLGVLLIYTCDIRRSHNIKFA